MVEGVGKVHIDKGRGTATRRFDASQQAAPINELGCDTRGLCGEYVVFQPIHEPQVVHYSPQQNHGDLAMGVDETGDDPMTRGI